MGLSHGPQINPKDDYFVGKNGEIIWKGPQNKAKLGPDGAEPAETLTVVPSNEKQYFLDRMVASKAVNSVCSRLRGVTLTVKEALDIYNVLVMVTDGSLPNKWPPAPAEAAVIRFETERRIKGNG